MAKYDATALTANGSTQGIKLYNGRGDGNLTNLISVFGTFGGGTAALEYSPDQGSTWIAVTDSAGAVTFTANGGKNIIIPSDAQEPVQVRITLSGATSPNLNFNVFSVR